MEWAVKLITAPRGTVIDPFAGTGPTGEAAALHGFSSILIEREEEYCKDILHRLAFWLAVGA